MSYSSIRTKLLVDGHCTAEDARAFFEDLFLITHRRIPEIAGPAFAADFPTRQFRGPGGLTESHNGWRYGTPIGVCDHFTADTSLAGTLRWFSSHEWAQPDGTKRTSRASSEIVVDLDGTPYCLVDFWNGRAAWHEPQLNGLTIGIEHVAAGELRTLDGHAFTYWPNNWTRPYMLAAELPPVQVDWRGARWMQPFTREQVITNLVLKRALVCLYDTKMRPEMFVDHATYRDDKLDMGPLWPLATLRGAAFQMEPLDRYVFMHAFTPVPRARFDALDPADLQVIQRETTMALPLSQDDFPNESATLLWTQLALQARGYVVDPTGRPNKQTTDAIKEFQIVAGLTVDGVPGPKTRAALLKRN